MGTPFEIGATCTSAEYEAISGNKISVKNRSKYPFIGYMGVTGSAECSPTEGRCQVSFSGSDDPLVDAGNYQVLGTDYTNYSVVRSCAQYGPTKAEVVWVLSRTPKMTKEVRADVDSVLHAKLPAYDSGKWGHLTYQESDCTY